MTDSTLTELHELLAWLTEHAAEVPTHRRRQAVLHLERVERLVPLSDTEADEIGSDQP